MGVIVAAYLIIGFIIAGMTIFNKTIYERIEMIAPLTKSKPVIFALVTLFWIFARMTKSK